jgi:hypothetical protein
MPKILLIDDDAIVRKTTPAAGASAIPIFSRWQKLAARWRLFQSRSILMNCWRSWRIASPAATAAGTRRNYPRAGIFYFLSRRPARDLIVLDILSKLHAHGHGLVCRRLIVRRR